MQRRTFARMAIGLGAIVMVAVFSTAVVAGTSGTVRGTAKADTLRGGPGADSMYGLGGNDTISGLAGNDRLLGGPGNDKLNGGPGNDTITGGPGVDRIVCGPGADIAIGNPKDTASADCEAKRGFKPAAPPPPVRTACENGQDDDGDGKVDYPGDPGCETTSDDDETDPVPVKKAQPGQYCGFTVQGPGICLTVSADGQHIDRFDTTSIVDCPNGERWEWSIYYTGWGLALDPNLSFKFAYAGPLGSSGGDVSNVVVDEFINGTVGEDGKASGTFALSKISYDYKGTHYDCTQGAVGWNVTRQG